MSARHRFVVYGDCCSGIPGALHEETAASVNQVVAALHAQPEFVCFLGDEVMGLTTSEDDLRGQWRYWLDHEMAWLDRAVTPLYNVPANHTTYDVMSEREPVLARLHSCTPDGRVARDSRDWFALFLIGWLGGPQDYLAKHGHPRLRMRHGRVIVNVAMRDAWLRAMKTAMDEMGLQGELRDWLDTRFADVADFLRNAPG